MQSTFRALTTSYEESGDHQQNERQYEAADAGGGDGVRAFALREAALLPQAILFLQDLRDDIAGRVHHALAFAVADDLRRALESVLTPRRDTVAQDSDAALGEPLEHVDVLLLPCVVRGQPSKIRDVFRQFEN